MIIDVVFHGARGSGKTLLMRAIRNWLVTFGVNCEINDDGVDTGMHVLRVDLADNDKKRIHAANV